MKYFLKKLYQRLTQGFPDEEVWNLKETTAKFIIPRLERLQKIKHGYPQDLTQEEWDEILNKMIRAFYIVIEEDDLFENRMSMEEYLEHDKISEKRKKEGLELFVKHFDSLWD